MRDIQFHPVTDKLVHIDFITVPDNQKIKLNIPISVEGNSVGVRNGGRLTLNMRTLSIEALEQNLPETITVDISELKIGQSLRVSDLSFDGITILSKADDVIVGIKTSRAVAEEEEEDTEGAEKEGGDSEIEEPNTENKD